MQPVLYADRGCPFTHRVLSLLEHLGVACELCEAPFGQLPDGLEQLSPSGRIPLLVLGSLVIGESRVMLEHLAECYGFADAYPRELEARTLHRHAMALMDVYIAPTFGRGDAAVDERRLAECLDVIADVTRHAPSAPSLLGFHLGPLWRCFRDWRPRSAVTRVVYERSQLAAWLDAVAELPAVVRSARPPVPREWSA